MKAILTAIVLAAAIQPPAEAPRISQLDFKKRLAARNVIVVDTRNADVFSAGHIPGAIQLPLEGLLTWPEAFEKNAMMLRSARKPIVTYCA